MVRFFTLIKEWFLNYSVAWILVSIFLATHWSLLFTPQFFRVHDFTHATRISEMARALADGHFPVRWSENLGFGYGMPLFNFYAPLPYYVGAGFYLLGFDIIVAIKLLYIIAGIITILGAYQLGKTWYGRWGGVITAAAFALAPYRAVNLFVRGALSEAWAMAFLPVILWGMTRVIRKDLAGWKWLVFGLVGLFLSHNITTLLFVPVSLLIGFGLLVMEWLKAEKRWRLSDWLNRIVQLAGAYSLAGLLAAFYLVPAFLEKDYTKFAATILSGYFDYHLHFLYLRQFIKPFWDYGGSNWGPDDGMSFYFGTGQLVALILLGLTGLELFIQTRKKAFQLALFLPGLAALIFLIGSFFSLERSVKVWEAIPFLAFAQFPWRWLSVASFGLALLVGSLGLFTPKVWWRTPALALLVLVILIGNAVYFRPINYLQDSNAIYYTDPGLIQKNMSDILPDYIPAQMPDELIPPTTLWLNSELTKKDVEVLVNHTQEKLYRVTVKEPTLFETVIADFPGWTTELDGILITHQAGPHGTVSVLVPAGTHTVGVLWVSSQIQYWSNLASLIGVVFVLGLGVYFAEQRA